MANIINEKIKCSGYAYFKYRDSFFLKVDILISRGNVHPSLTLQLFRKKSKLNTDYSNRFS
jgi:hypothetical protein